MTDFDSLNKEQKEACFHTEGPVLILAGAGSGKTRVITHRIAWLMEQGVNPWNILAITFTNKAAGEMRERVDRLVGFGSESIWISTFHSMCVRILRRYINLIGYETGFTIYDTDDQKTLMKQILKQLAINPKDLREKTVLSAISSAKNQLETPMKYRETHTITFEEREIGECYEQYQAQLHKNNALDFDDLLMKTVELFTTHPEVLENYQNRFLYVHVDEYQDTNRAQFELIRLLTEKSRNLCVVGDDDQSIYKFRGADIRNILNFEKVFPDAFVVKLEQNYRSTQNILDAANAVIHNNANRKEKLLWTSQGAGAKIHFRQLDSAMEEAEYIADDVRDRMDSNPALKYRDFAVLYRTNAQARVLEERFVMDSIPYNVVGGTNFYARREIKDLLAYLGTIDNGADDIAVRRILNVPKRGIGATTQERIAEYAAGRNISFFQAMEETGQIVTIAKGTAAKILPFVELIHTFRNYAREHAADSSLVSDLLKKVIADSGYADMLRNSEEEDAEDRLSNIDELVTKAVTYEQQAVEEPATLSGFLEEVALVADIDNVGEDDNRVLLMTLHSAKGLEFPVVYMAGMEDGVFPGEMTITSGNEEEMEEERRLAYVGITRAKSDLTLTCAKSRMLRGEIHYNPVSRFVREIPAELLDTALPAGSRWDYADDDADEYYDDYSGEYSGRDYGEYSRRGPGGSAGGYSRAEGRHGGSGSFGGRAGGRTFVTYGYSGKHPDHDPDHDPNLPGSDGRAALSSNSFDASGASRNPAEAHSWRHGRRELGAGAHESRLAGGTASGGTIGAPGDTVRVNPFRGDPVREDSSRENSPRENGILRSAAGETSDRSKAAAGTGAAPWETAPCFTTVNRGYTDSFDTGERKKTAAYSPDGRPKAVYRGNHTDSAHKPFIAKAKSLSGLKKGAQVQAEKPDYEVGDRVRHVKFGEGVVKEIEETPRDYKVTVVFDTYGQKVMYAAFAKLQKVL